MEFDFSKTDKPVTSIPVALNTVYIVYADPSYDVKKGRLITKDIVALRTIKGSGNVIIDGIEEIVVTSDTLLFFEHRKVRRYYCSSEQWDFWWFEFQVPESILIPLNRIFELPIKDDEIIYFNHCLEYLRKDQKAYAQMASACFSFILQHWLLQYNQIASYSHPHEAAIEKVIDYMNTHLSENLPIKTLAKIAGLSERRFRQIFKEITGMQPKKYLDKLRIRMAEELLINTPFSIGDISLRLGYSSQFHFCKAFKKTHGVPPSHFRGKNHNT